MLKIGVNLLQRCHINPFLSVHVLIYLFIYTCVLFTRHVHEILAAWGPQLWSEPGWFSFLVER